MITKKTSIQLESPVRRPQLSPHHDQDKARHHEKQLTWRSQKTKGANAILIKETNELKQLRKIG